MKRLLLVFLLALSAQADTTVGTTFCSGGLTLLTTQQFQSNGAPMTAAATVQYSNGVFSRAFTPASDSSYWTVRVRCPQATPASDATERWLIPDSGLTLTRAEVTIAATGAVSPEKGWYWDATGRAWASLAAAVTASSSSSTVGFANVTAGTGSAALVVGTGGSIAASGSGTIAATTAAALAANPSDCAANQFANAIAANGNLTCAALALAGAQFANQGTTTTVLHGNAAGNPSFSAVSLTADVSGALPTANMAPAALVRTCEIVIGDPGAASPVLANDNDSPAVCGNKTGATLTITAVECYADAGSPTVTPIITGGGAILTGALTCGTGSFASGTLSGTPTQSANGSIDGVITSAGGVAKYLVLRITRSL